LSSLYASGWLPYDGDCALYPENHDSDLKGWLHYGANLEPGKAFVYDAPNGRLLGYAYSQLGYVTLADDAKIDAHAMRVARLGCDQFTDDRCASTGLEPPGHP
jgi:hypothetical protein